MRPGLRIRELKKKKNKEVEKGVVVRKMGKGGKEDGPQIFLKIYNQNEIVSN